MEVLSIGTKLDKIPLDSIVFTTNGKTASGETLVTTYYSSSTGYYYQTSKYMGSTGGYVPVVYTVVNKPVTQMTQQQVIGDVLSTGIVGPMVFSDTKNSYISRVEKAKEEQEEFERKSMQKKIAVWSGILAFLALGVFIVVKFGFKSKITWIYLGVLLLALLSIIVFVRLPFRYYSLWEEWTNPREENTTGVLTTAISPVDQTLTKQVLSTEPLLNNNAELQYRSNEVGDMSGVFPVVPMETEQPIS